MNRQGFASMRLSTLNVQQGLFASLALMVTLIGGQQMQHWQQSQQQVPHFEHSVKTQTHFRSVGSVAADVTAPPLRVADQDSTLGELPVQERWVF